MDNETQKTLVDSSLDIDSQKTTMNENVPPPPPEINETSKETPIEKQDVSEISTSEISTSEISNSFSAPTKKKRKTRSKSHSSNKSNSSTTRHIYAKLESIHKDVKNTDKLLKQLAKQMIHASHKHGRIL